MIGHADPELQSRHKKNSGRWLKSSALIFGGIKTWFLQEGIYKARLLSSKAQQEPDWKLFAVVDGKGEPLTEAEVFHIFQDEVVES